MVMLASVLLLVISIAALVLTIYYFVLLHCRLLKFVRTYSSSMKVLEKKPSIYSILFSSYEHDSLEVKNSRDKLFSVVLRFVCSLVVAIISGYFFEYI